MRKLTFILATALMGLALSCNKQEQNNGGDDKKTPAGGNTPIELKADTTTPEMNTDTQNSEVLNLTWNATTNMGTGARVSYSVLIDTKGGNLESAYEIPLGPSITSHTFTAGELNRIIKEEFDHANGDVVEMDFVVYATIASTEVEDVVSNRVTVTLTYNNGKTLTDTATFTTGKTSHDSTLDTLTVTDLSGSYGARLGSISGGQADAEIIGELEPDGGNLTITASPNDENAVVVIDGKNGADVLIDRIAETWIEKDSVIRIRTKDVIAAASMLTDAITEQAVTWYAFQDSMNQSALEAVKRPISGGWGFGGEHSGPIEAAALAYWGAKTTKRDPSREMRIG